MNDNLRKLIDQANNIVIIQADNPDGDSLASCIALEGILFEQKKTVTMFCAVNIPTYLRHINGWDRVVNELPQQFDLSIIIDTSSVGLLETLVKNGQIAWIKSKPCIIIDHHSTPPTIDFHNLIINEAASSTGEVIYKLAKENNWHLDKEIADCLAYSILFDTLGLSTESVTSNTLKTMADLLDLGVNLAELDNNRRLSSKKSLELTKYKGELLNRIELFGDGQIALIHIPWPEIEKYSYQYNPSMLVIDEMRMIEGVQVAIAFKTYPDGKITAKIRTNFGIKLADKIAENFGGGGHSYASGFKITDGKTYDQVKDDSINKIMELLNETV